MYTETNWTEYYEKKKHCIVDSNQMCTLRASKDRLGATRHRLNIGEFRCAASYSSCIYTRAAGLVYESAFIQDRLQRVCCNRQVVGHCIDPPFRHVLTKCATISFPVTELQGNVHCNNVNVLAE